MPGFGYGAFQPADTAGDSVLAAHMYAVEAIAAAMWARIDIGWGGPGHCVWFEGWMLEGGRVDCPVW